MYIFLHIFILSYNLSNLKYLWKFIFRLKNVFFKLLLMYDWT